MLPRTLIASVALVLTLSSAACGDGSTPAASASAATTPEKTAAKTSAPAPSTAEPKPTPAPQKKLAELLVGAWRYESIEMPGTPEAAKKAVEGEMKSSRLEFKDGKFTSYEKERVFSTSEYEVEREEGRKISVKLIKSKKTETYEFTDDDTLTTSDKELGKIVLKRQK